MERFSVSNRLENAKPSVVAKKDSTEPIPEKYKKDIAALQEKYGSLSSLTGLSISLTLKEALEIMPRNRRRVDAYEGLKNYLKKQYEIILTIKSQKNEADTMKNYFIASGAILDTGMSVEEIEAVVQENLDESMGGLVQFRILELNESGVKMVFIRDFFVDPNEPVILDCDMNLRSCFDFIR